MKRIICLLLVCLLAATLPFGSVAAAAPKPENAKVTLVYQHELPNCPGKSIKAVLVEYGPGGYSPAHTHAKSAFIYATVLEGAIRSQVNDGPVKAFTAGEASPSCQVIGMSLARMAARQSRPSSSPCSSSTQTKRN